MGLNGSGKSTIALYDLFLHCQKYPRCDSLVVRDTFPALRDSCYKSFMALFASAGEAHLGPPPTFTWRVGEMRGQVMFRALESPEDIMKVQSVECGYCWIEELTPGILKDGLTYQGVSQEVFAGLFARIRQQGVPRRMVISSLPPPSTRHWSHRLFYEKKAVSDVAPELMEYLTDEIALYQLTPYENLAHLPEGYYASQLPLLATREQIQRFIEGRVGSAYMGASVYPGWNDTFHLKRNLQPYPGPLIRGWDFGLNPACVFFQLTPTGGCYVLAELFGEGVGLEEFAPVVVAEGNRLFGPRAYTDYGDRSGFNRSQNDRNSCADVLRKISITLRPGVQSIVPRVNAVRGWLGRMGASGALFNVHERCEALIEGFRGAYRRKVVAGVALDEPDDNKSHPYSDVHDALQHALAAVTGTQSAERIGPGVMPPGPFGAQAGLLRNNVIQMGAGRLHRRGRG